MRQASAREDPDERTGAELNRRAARRVAGLSLSLSPVRIALALSILGGLYGGLAQPPSAEAGDAPDVNSLGLSATYDVAADFSWAERTVTVDTAATVTGSRPWSSATLAFNLSTLRTGRAEIDSVTVDGAPVQPRIDDQTLLVDLPAPLQPAGSVVVRIVSTARLNASPRQGTDEWGFARTGDVLTAYRWIPWLSRTTPFDRPSVGDPFVTASSPLVRVRVAIEQDLVYATSGVEVEREGTGRLFEARNVRDFNLTASPAYRTASRSVRGTTINLRYRTLDPDKVLDIVARAFDAFSDKIGRYPYPTLEVAEIGPWAPLESPALFWMPDNASPRLAPWLLVHETAHQWFYAVVGNDQAREPFADEALTDFLARDHIDRFVPSRCPPGKLDATIYDLGECYPWVVYVQGVAYLRERREAMGSANFWRAAADYYAANRFGLAGTRELLAALAGRDPRPADHDRRFPSIYPPAFPCLPFGSL